MKLAPRTRRVNGWACLWALAVSFLPLAPQRLSAAEPETATIQEVDRLLAALDDAQFAERKRAFARLDELARRPALGGYLSRRFRGVILEPDSSFEVRSQLETLLRALPPTPGEPVPGSKEVAPLIEALHSDVYATRDSAERRLKSMLGHVELIAPVWLELKRAAGDASLSASARHALAPLLRKAHEAWLLADPAKVPLPMPPAEQIEKWIDQTARHGGFVTEGDAGRGPAQRELLDLLARDDTRGVVLVMIEERIANDRESAGVNALKDLIEFARPGMVAEVWSNGALRTVQYLTIGVPQLNETAIPPRATHFDRIDDQTAHCVSGNSLSEGDYPVGIAIPHPEAGQPTLFYLSNLSTPRRRLVYEYRLERDPAALVVEMTERTLGFYLRRQAPLTENEILLLAQLDARSVSRFAGDYFEAVPNTGLIPTPNGLAGMTSVHGGICSVVGRIGTREAVPALERLARKGSLGKLSFDNRHDAAWVAALAIAQRDPWDDVDSWLAGLIDEHAPLSAEPEKAPELGATAAGLLLDRHGVSTQPFGLAPAGESLTEIFRFSGYRFTAEQDRQDVKRWWQKQQQLAAAARAAKSSASATDPRNRVRGGARRSEASQP